ncbi:MAG: hypothetical protein HYS62_01200 [Candidatus Aenigmarchaeota archaeon]|nr:hypothetical protein [Candidatus Aenigmarchaeota archaeon]
MDEGIVKISPDKEKAKSLFEMVNITLEMIKSVDSKKFSSLIIKDYYEAIRGLVTAILLVDGFKTEGEGAHKRLIDYLNVNYKQFSQYEISLIDDLRIIRNRIAYEGFFVKEDYLERKRKDISSIITKLVNILKDKLR